MSHTNEKASLVAAVGVAAVALVLSLAVTSTIAFGFITGRPSVPAASQSVAAQPALETAARS